MTTTIKTKRTIHCRGQTMTACRKIVSGPMRTVTAAQWHDVMTHNRCRKCDRAVAVLGASATRPSAAYVVGSPC